MKSRETILLTVFLLLFNAGSQLSAQSEDSSLFEKGYRVGLAVPAEDTKPALQGKVAKAAEQAGRFRLETREADGSFRLVYETSERVSIEGVHSLFWSPGAFVILLDGSRADRLGLLEPTTWRECSLTPIHLPQASPGKSWVAAQKLEPKFSETRGYGVQIFDVRDCGGTTDDLGWLEPSFELERREPEDAPKGVRFRLFRAATDGIVAWLGGNDFAFVESADRKLLVHQVALSKDGQATDVVKEIPSLFAANGEARLWSTLLERHGNQLKLEKLWVEEGMLRAEFGLFDSAERFSASVPLATEH